MLRRAAHSLAAAFAALSLLAPPAPAQEAAPAPAPGSVRLDIGEARLVAMRALGAGRPDLAAAIARALIAHDPQDFEAHLVLAAAETRLGHGDAGVASAQRALALAKTADQRFFATREVASGLAQQGRWTLSELWLRRAAQSARSDEQTTLIARDYGYVRQKNPLSFEFAASAGPNPNITNASSAPVIWLFTPFGILPLAPTVYSGITAEASAAVTYRLRHDNGSLTYLGLSGYGRLNRFDSASRAKLLAGESERDFDFAQAAISLRHLAPLADGSVLELGASAGRSWYGWARYADFVSAGAEWRTALPGGDEFAAFANASLQFFARAGAAPILNGEIGARYDHAFGSGDRLTATLAAGGARSTDASAAYRGLRLGLDYDLGRPVFGAELAVSLSAGLRDYAFSPWSSTGRRDWSLGTAVEAAFPDAAVMGFVPVLSAGIDRSFSNISAFDTQTYRIGLGVRSQF